jgi:aspartyl aminopeptidase
MAIHGVVVRKDGSVENVVVGEEETDPILMFTDILPHLGADQMSGTAAKIIEGEKLDLLIGNKPEKDVEKDAVKAAIVTILKEKYNIEEEDFISAEIEIVPAGKSRDCGLDRSMIAGYGHDDRVCAYPSLVAMLEVEAPKRTTCCLLVDKEEIIGAMACYGNEIDDLIVNHKFQKQGYGKQLLLWGIQRIRERSDEPITLHVAAWNQGAVALYEKCGFEIVKREKV